VATPKNHDFIAAVKRKNEDDTDKYELSISPSFTRVFNSNAALNDYLTALGLEEIRVAPKAP